MQFGQLKRRELITALGVAATWPFAARAQQFRTIGYLGSGTAAAQGQFAAAFVQRLSDLGWIEGRNIRIEYRWGEGRNDRIAECAAELVGLKVDAIVTSGSVAVLAAKQLTSSIPIVFAANSDPVGSGLVASLGRPGSNVTGLSVQSAETTGKQIELLREVIPSIRRLGIIANSGSPGSMLEMKATELAAKSLGLDVMESTLQRPEDISLAFDAITGHADALYVVADPLVNSIRIPVTALAQDARIPAIYGNKEFAEAGGLMSYGPDLPDLFRRSADFVDKILRGAKPADIPVEQPTKFDLVLNLKTAKTLGVTFPPTLLARADVVIE
jgi:putative tryptophan/tyrosine transport system substrate-binding protein